ncbi:MAG: RdgB/HAM1 family non-canonical purine NTP pyrophosphatase [Chitinophagales bacterium]
MKIIFATHNENKVKEVREMLPPSVEIVSLREMDYHEEIEETGTTIEENSKIKAETIFQKYQVPVLAEDTGLEVESLDNAPGVYTARYAGADAQADDNMNLLLKNLENHKNRKAQFKTVATFITKNTSNQYLGIVRGQILEDKKGDYGFGYDPIFSPAGYSKSFAQLGAREKSLISHRAFAIKKFLQDLEI